MASQILMTLSEHAVRASGREPQKYSLQIIDEGF